MNITGFDKVAPYLTHPLVLWCCFGLLILGVLLKYGERKGRLPHLVFFLILLVMVAVIYLGREEKTVWIPAAITMLGIAAPVALTWKSSVAGPNTAVPVDAGQLAEKLVAPLQGQLEAKDEQIKALTEAITALSKADAPTASINDALRALEQGDTAKAQVIFTEVLRSKEAEGRKANKEAAAAARHLGALAYTNNPLEALPHYRKAVQLDPDNTAGWVQLGNLLFRTGELTQAEEAFHKVLALAEAHQNKKEQATALGNLGNVYYKRGDLNKAEEMHCKSLEIDNYLVNKQGMAISYGNLGIVYYIRGNVDQAEEMYQKALDLNKALGSKEGMARDYGNLGLVYDTRGNQDKAKEMLKKALSLNKALDSKEGIAANYSNLGIMYKTRGNLNKAEQMYQKALKLAKALGSKEGMAIQYGNLGIVHRTRGELDKAEEMYRKSLEIHQALGSKEGMAIDYTNLGILYEQRGNLEQAETAWKKSLRLYQEMKMPDAKDIQQWLDDLAKQRAAQQAPSTDNPR